VSSIGGRDAPTSEQSGQKPERKHQMQPALWTAQPRVTSKSEWISYSAGESQQRKSQMHIASFDLGICIMTDTLGHTYCPIRPMIFVWALPHPIDDLFALTGSPFIGIPSYIRSAKLCSRVWIGDANQ